MSYTTENFYQAIDALNNGNSEARSEAHQWLLLFQKSIESWSVTEKVIAERKSYNSTIFAAQTIRNKILHDFRELPADTNYYISLRDSIINHLRSIETNFSENSTSVITYLAAALADLYLQVPHWNNFIGEMFGELSQSNTILLTLFKVFPEELYNRNLRVGENRRSIVEKELADKTDLVIQLLSHLCENDGGDYNTQTKVISCLSSWLLNKQCSTEILASCQLLHSILSALKNPDCQNDVHDAACDCIVNALFLIDDTKKHENLARLLQHKVYETVDAFNQAIVKEDYEKLQNYARIYCELCESFLPQIMSEPGVGFGDLRSLDMLFLVIGYHDFQLAEMTFNVWYRLSEFLYQAEDIDFEQLRVVFSPYIERYIMALYKHCKLDIDLQDIIVSDSEIACFREKAAESVKDVTFIIGSVNLLKNMLNLLNSCSNGTWNEIESALFIISCTIHNVIETENEVVPVLLNAVFSFPTSTHKMLLSTSANMLGNLKDWLCTNSSYLISSIDWLISLANNNISLIKTLAKSIENICENGFTFLSNYFDSLTQIILNIENIAHDGQTIENASHYLLRACTHLVNDLPSNEIATRLERLCARPIEYLNKIVTGQLQENVEDKENATVSWKQLSLDPVLWLDRLAAIYRVLKPWQSQNAFKQLTDSNENGISYLAQGPEAPWLQLTIRVWQIVSQTLQHFRQHTRVSEHACRTTRFIIRSMGIQSIVFISDLATQIMTVYNEYPHSCFLYLASIIVDEYGSVYDVQDGLITMMNTLAERSFTLLNGENCLKNHPDTVDDLFRLAIRFVQRLPQKFFSQPIFEMLVSCAIMGLELDHSDANRSVSKFILESIDVARKVKTQTDISSEYAEAIILKYGNQIVWQTINASLFNLSNMLKKEMSEIIFTIGQFSKEKQLEWIDFSIQNLPHDCGLTATTEQLCDFKNKVCGAQKQYEVLVSIRDLCKYYT